MAPVDVHVPGLSILVVVYQKRVGESRTLASLSELPEDWRRRIELVVRDNSRISRIDPVELQFRGFANVQVSWDGQNLALGHVYRDFVRAARKEVLFFFDDDTQVPLNYLEEVLEVLGSPDRGGERLVCIPRIHDRVGRLFSPSHYGVFSGALLPRIEPGEYKGLNAIMSGVAVTVHYLEVLAPSAFSVRSRLYSVDTMFMFAHAQAGGTTRVCQATILHDLNRDARRSPREVIHRSWLEGVGIFWTTISYRTPWIVLLPLYLAYFAFMRLLLACRMVFL